MEAAKKILTDFNEKIAISGVIFGELGFDSQIFDSTLSRASHCIKDLTIENNSIFGEVQVLSTYWGLILKELLKPNSNELTALNRDAQIESIISDKDYVPLAMEDFDIITLSSIRIEPRYFGVINEEKIVNIQKFFTFDIQHKKK